MKYVHEQSEEPDFQPSYVRTRAKDSLFYPANYREYWWNSSQNPKPAEPAKVPNVMFGILESMTDVVTPAFKKLSSSGSVVNSPMQKTSYSYKVLGEGGIQCSTVNPLAPTITQYGDIVGLCLSTRPRNINTFASIVSSACPSLVTSADRSTTIALASTSARSKIEPPAFTGLVSIGELRETLRYLRNPLKQGVKLAGLLERDLKMAGTATRRGSTTSEIASLYLEFRYAVRPLLSEVQKGLEAIDSQKLAHKPIRQTARASASKTETTSLLSPSAHGSITYDELRVSSHELTVKSGFLYEHLNGFDLQSHWGMDLSQIPAAMWELTPLSFMYDWVINAGEFISAITPVAGIKHLSCWTTVTEVRRTTISGSNYKLAGWSNVVGGYNSVALEVVQKTRTPVVNAPSLVFRGLDRVSDDALKLLDVIGVFKQKLDPLSKNYEKFEADVKRGQRFHKKLSSF